MSEDADNIEAVRSAKNALQEEYGECAWFRGVGIAPSESGFLLRLNVDPNVEVETGEIPHCYQGHGIEIVYIGAYKPRHCPSQQPGTPDCP